MYLGENLLEGPTGLWGRMIGDIALFVREEIRINEMNE
jgi:hypothetical protein